MIFNSPLLLLYKKSPDINRDIGGGSRELTEAKGSGIKP